MSERLDPSVVRDLDGQPRPFRSLSAWCLRATAPTPQAFSAEAMWLLQLRMRSIGFAA